MTVRSRIAMLVAEFLGTAILATVAINVSRSQIGIGYFVAIAVGGALAFLVLALGPTSGGHFNPAVTIGMWTLRKIGTIQALAYLAVQMLAGLAAWQLATYFLGDNMRSIAGNSFDWHILVAEAIGAMVFTFVIAAAVFNDYIGGKAAALIGGGLFMGTVVASLGSNAILNPAIALANQSWGRAYIFGPIIGAVIGMNLYVLIFAPLETLLPRRAGSKPAVGTADDTPVVSDKRNGRGVTASRAATTKKAPAKKKPVARKRK